MCAINYPSPIFICLSYQIFLTFSLFSYSFFYASGVKEAMLDLTIIGLVSVGVLIWQRKHNYK